MNTLPDPIHPLINAYLGEDPLVLIEELRVLGEQKAKLSGIHQTLEHRRKIVLAEIANEQRATGPKLAVEALKDYCHAHPTYLEYVDSMANVIESVEALEDEYWAKKARLDFLNNCMAFVRSESYALRS